MAVVTTRCAHPKAADPTELAIVLREQFDVDMAIGENIDDILAEVYVEADQTVVAGSLYLAGAVRSLVKSGALEGLEPGQGPAHEE